MKKATFESVCKKAGLGQHRRGDVFVADGYIAEVGPFADRFGIDEKDFEDGAYCTMWAWIPNEIAYLAGGNFYKRDHDADKLALSEREQARVSAAFGLAEVELSKFKDRVDALKH